MRGCALKTASHTPSFALKAQRGIFSVVSKTLVLFVVVNVAPAAL